MARGHRSKLLQDHMDRAARLGCLVCEHMGLGESPAVLHHPRFDVGGAQRESDWLAVPLCPEHHVGAGGIHTLGAEGFYRRYCLSEVDLVAMMVQGVAESRARRVGG